MRTIINDISRPSKANAGKASGGIYIQHLHNPFIAKNQMRHIPYALDFGKTDQNEQYNHDEDIQWRFVDATSKEKKKGGPKPSIFCPECSAPVIRKAEYYKDGNIRYRQYKCPECKYKWAFAGDNPVSIDEFKRVRNAATKEYRDRIKREKEASK